MKRNILINILTPFPHQTFLRQLDPKMKEEGFLFYENETLSVLWDMVIVYEGIAEHTKIKCRKGGLVFISGEPPWSRKYSAKYLKQFDYIITSHTKIKHPGKNLIQQALPWHFGFNYREKKFNYDFDDIEKMPAPQKTKKISFITSNKCMMPGHKQRMLFLEVLKSKFDNEIDVFGYGINPIDDKAKALLPYQFCICLENSSIYNYWTEKIADPILAYCIPIYYGCKNIDQYFNRNVLIKIDPKYIGRSIDTIEHILVNANMIYNEKLEQLKIERIKLIKEYSLFAVLIEFYRNNIQDQIGEDIVINLRPAELFWDNHALMSILRMKRYIYRYL